MTHFDYSDGELHAEAVPLKTIAAEIGTPFYCYASTAIEENYRAFAGAFAGQDALICYSLKANSNLAVVRTLAAAGAGADVVSEGELRRALSAGIPAARIAFSGVGKTAAEMALALKAGIYQFNVESEPELHRLSHVAAELGQRAPVTIRVNPDIDALTHAKISTGKAENKFGVPWQRARAVYRQAAALPGIEIVGVDVHIGSQLLQLEPFEAAFTRVAALVAELRADGHRITRLDLGGGLGISYRTAERPPELAAYAAMIARVTGKLGCTLVLEPGRRLIGDAGVLVARVIYVKAAEHKTFVILDAAMNDLIRPSLYEAWHDIVPLTKPAADAPYQVVDIVGPVCESGDTLATDRRLPALAPGDLVAIRQAGAYGAVMASTYNTRPLIPEVLVKNAAFAAVRPRPSYDEMLAQDRLPPWLEGKVAPEAGKPAARPAASASAQVAVTSPPESGAAT